MSKKDILLVFLFGAVLGACRSEIRTSLLEQFRTPPSEARPRVWWHWMNGNITEDGITKDLLWMKDAGIAGFTNFDAGMETPQMVDHRLIYMTPEWKKAFQHALHLADSLGLEVTIASSPGWSITGGPWVSPDDAMKKIVWRDTLVAAGDGWDGTLPEGYTVCGPYQDVPRYANDFHRYEYYKDVAIVAVKLSDSDRTMEELGGRVSISSVGDARLLSDGDLCTPCAVSPDVRDYAWIQVEFPQPLTMRSLRLALTGRENYRTDRVLECSDDGRAWHTVLDHLPLLDVRSMSIDFPDATARYFRFRSSQAGEPMYYSEFCLSPVARVNLDTEKAGFCSFRDIPDETDCDYRTPETGDAVPFGDVLVLSDKYLQGKLRWEVPEGRWRIFRFGYNLTGQQNAPASPEATGLEVDKFDAEAVKRYYHHYLEMYQDASKGKLGSVVSHLMIDSYEAGYQTWTARMPELFLEKKGYDMIPWLPVLTGQIVGSAEQSERFLFDWRVLLSDLICENHYDVMKEILEPYGMKRYNESQEHYRMYVADGMDVKRNAEIPMSAFWIRDNGQYTLAALPEADIRESASVAHIYGQNICAAESFTTYGLGTPNGVRAYVCSPSTLKHAADAAMSYGLNRFTVHCSVHQPCDDKFPGVGLGPYGQWFNRHETWAHEARAWTDYLSRSSFLLQQGRYVADIAYFYGEDKNITSRFGSDRVDIVPGYGFDFVNATILKDVLHIDGNALTTASGMHYKALVLDNRIRYMSLSVLQRIAEMVRSGILLIGNEPEGCASIQDDMVLFEKLKQEIWHSGSPHVYAFSQMEDALKKKGIEPDVELYPAIWRDVHYVHRRVEDLDIYWIANIAPEQRQIEVSLRAKGRRPELWHADTGTVKPATYRMENDRTIVSLDMEPDDAVFIVLAKNTKQCAWKEPVSKSREVLTLEESWKVSFQSGRGVPSSIQLPRLSSLSESEEEGVRFFSGTATYDTSFMMEHLDREAQYWLDLGAVSHMARVRLNGQDLGLVWKVPYRVRVDHVLRQGRNELEVEVTNSWQNRLIGDVRSDVGKRLTYTAVEFYSPDDQLVPAGLMGPVKILEKK